MKTRLEWVDNVCFKATTGSGHQIIMDGAPEYGGDNRGARPMEMVLVGLAGCASFDIITILKKSRQDISDVICEIEAERADAVPAVFTKIHLHFIIKGKALKVAQVEKAVNLSAEKYCSVSHMLSTGGVEVSHDFEVIEG
ncbi:MULTISPECIES: OsmC family protein [unclassified Acinetobacter]|uniref:OsmC family protein n=1 Tax=unclassified Acinetobacter TaxID=196816 RepID=UPI0035BA6F6C